MVTERRPDQRNGPFYAQTPDGSGCQAAGPTMPTATIPGRTKLVYQAFCGASNDAPKKLFASQNVSAQRAVTWRKVSPTITYSPSACRKGNFKSFISVETIRINFPTRAKARLKSPTVWCSRDRKPLMRRR